MASLSQTLQTVNPDIQRRVQRPGALTNEELVSLTTRPDADPAVYFPDQAEDRNVSDWSTVTPADEIRGEQAIANGEVAFVLLAGGAGTRIGQPKIFLKLPEIELSLLAWKLLQAGQMPVWVMATPELSGPIHKHINELSLPAGLQGSVFEQFEGYRLTPDNRLSLVDNVPELYPLGHGDVGPALVESGILDENPQVKYVFVSNVDNVLASPHPGIIGRHIRTGAPVTCEVVERKEGDRGGVVAWVNNKLQVAEDFRLPPGFADEAKFHNTNSLLINVDVLRWPIPWRWHRVKKQVDSRVVIQYERLLQQYTEECDTDFLLVPRDARYCPIKTPEDLERAGKLLSTYRFQ